MPLMLGSTTSLGSSTPSSGSGTLSAIAAASLTDLCAIYGPPDPTTLDDGQGTTTTGVADVLIASDVPCRLYKARSDREVLQAGALSTLTMWTLDVPLGTDLEPAYTVLKDGLSYNVIDTNEGETGAVLLTAVLNRITGG